MEINSLGFMNFDNYRMTASRSSSVPQENFMERLQRAYGTSENIETENITVAGKVDKNDRLYQLCLELETFIVKNMLNGMRNTIQKSSLIEEGFAGKMYEDMLYDEYAKDMAKNANFGLAEQAYLQLKRYSY